MKSVIVGMVLVSIVATANMLMAYELGESTGEQYEAQGEVPHKSPVVAVLLPIGVTAGSIIIGVLIDKADLPELGVPISLMGAIVGPSTGHMYTGSWWRVLGFSLGRAAMIGLFCYGLSRLDWFFGGGEGETEMMLGSLGWLALTVVEIVMSGFDAKRFNEEARVSLSPLIVPPAYTGENAYHLGFSLSFEF